MDWTKWVKRTHSSGERQKAEGPGFFFFFPWMVNTGILGTQEKELGVGDRRGTWLHEVGLELVGEGEQKGEPDSRHRERWAGLRTLCREALRRPGLAGLSEEPLQQSY